MNKKIVITGGTKGIGKAIIKKFAAEGFDVATCARNADDLRQLKLEIENNYDVRLYTIQTDVSKREEINRFIQSIKDDFGNPLVLVNNAGVFIPGAIHKEEEGALEKMINTNLYSAYHITRGFIEGMTSEKSGHVFNICSTASIIPYVNGGSYCISKFALLGMSKVLREEMKEFGVRVTSILPGATLTASWDGVDLPKERFMKSEDVAEVVWNAYSMSDHTVMEEVVMRPQLGDI